MKAPDIEKAIAILKRGGLVAMPTETVYGLAADAHNPQAVRRIFAAKQRPLHHPLIVHVANTAKLSHWAREIPDAVFPLAKAFWPGPLTLILKKQPHVLDMVTGGQDTIGLRVPCHPVAQALLQAFGGGLAAPSANQYTHVSPTEAAAVQEELADKVDMILDGGDCAVGLESTILDLTQAQPVILRPGMITQQMISDVLQVSVLALQQSAICTPGMHPVHYAPATKTVSIATDHVTEFVQSLSENIPTALITHTALCFPLPKQVHHVQLLPEPTAYAHDIYRVLRALDRQHFHQILIEKVPVGMDWDAIRDRLKKACGR